MFRKSITNSRIIQNSFIHPILYAKNIEMNLRNCYFLNKTQKTLYTILLWGINKNYEIHRILSTQISAKILGNLLRRKTEKSNKIYNASTISRMISKLKKHNMIWSERGSDKINRYYAFHPEKWTNEISNQKSIKNTHNTSYELFAENKKLPHKVYNKNILINSEKINEENNDKSTLEKINMKQEKKNKRAENLKSDKNLLKKARNYIDFIKSRGYKIKNEEAYRMKILEEGNKWNFKPIERIEREDRRREIEEEQSRKYKKEQNRIVKEVKSDKEKTRYYIKIVQRLQTKNKKRYKDLEKEVYKKYPSLQGKVSSKMMIYYISEMMKEIKEDKLNTLKV